MHTFITDNPQKVEYFTNKIWNKLVNIENAPYDIGEYCCLLLKWLGAQNQTYSEPRWIVYHVV